MLKKILLGLFIFLCMAFAWFYIVGKGWLGTDWYAVPVTDGPRPIQQSMSERPDHIPTEQQLIIGRYDTPQILFGDLHSHTNYSIDAYVFNTKAVKGGGIVTPADACDFARYCSALDFWSINDHAEGLTPRVWADTVKSIRECNAAAGDQANPDVVSFVGWEWSNGAKDDVPSHYGHKNVIFRTWEEGQTPTRPIAAAPGYALGKAPAALLGLLSLTDGVQDASDLGRFINESNETPVCPDDAPSNELSADCREVAMTPRDLYRKLDEWGFDSMVIPHGLAWGTTNPLTADFRDQMDQYEQRYENLLEMYSGHGNSEVFEDFQRIGQTSAGERYCPEVTANFTPCCQQAAVIAQARCNDSASAECAQHVEQARTAFVEKRGQQGRKLFPDATLDDWAGCGQLQNNFQPPSMYVPRMSAQYNLALGFDTEGMPKRARFGLIGSSDGHQGRPGSSYKETDRLLYTDSKDLGRETISTDFYKADKESGGFYYTGGLVAAHAQGRNRDAIWDALSNRNVYATSGDRMLVWFDLLNGLGGEVPMGSEVMLSETPRFRVRALGAFEQQPGCPDYTIAALGADRVQSLCGGECYRPGGDRRKAITRIEIVRIRPQVSPDEVIRPLIEDPWRVKECPADGSGCLMEFEDSQYGASARSALYYARVIQEPEVLIVGDPFGCEYDTQGQCIKRNYCIGLNAQPDDNCLSVAEPRAWTSPIFLEYP